MSDKRVLSQMIAGLIKGYQMIKQGRTKPKNWRKNVVYNS
jgi:hypothetical protein